MDADYEAVEGDELPLRTRQLTEEDGTPADLTAAAVLFRMHIRDESADPIVATATVGTPATDGNVTFPITGPPGTYNAEFVVTKASNDETYPRGRAPLRIVIRPRV